MDSRSYKPGDWVIYSKPKRSTRPGPRAKEVMPSQRGEDYSYFVDKFWLVVESQGDEVVVQTRRGKQHVLAVGNRNLRHARWWDRIVHRHRFPVETSSALTV